MKIALFGASGKTGQHLLRLALEAGHEVTALVRTPAKISLTHPNLRLVQGDLQDRLKVEQALQGAAAVLSTLGPSHNRPTFEISQGTHTLLAAMQACGVRRLVISAGAGVRDPNDTPGLFDRLIQRLIKLASRNVYEDMLRTVELVRASDRDWTVVRVPMLTDDPPKGSLVVTWVGKGMRPRLSRADLAGFMLQQLDSDEHLRQAPAISN
jgi:nucleoside-diphosphate-sugar epimerase